MKEYFESRSEIWDYIEELAWEYAELLNPLNMPKDWMFDTEYQPDGEGDYIKDSNLIWEGKWPLQNLWLGVTAENQAMANMRIPILLDITATKRFVSYEPALGAIDFNIDIDPLKWSGYTKRNLLSGILSNPYKGSYCATPVNKLDWIICGAESGPGHRPMDEEWAMQVKRDCVRFNVPFFFKQSYIGNKKIHMPPLDGRTWDQIPQ
jgi:protein gp37